MAPLITVEDAAALLPIRPGITKFDAKLRMLIDSASALIEQTISRELDKRERIEYFDSPNTYKAYYDFTSPENPSGLYGPVARSVRYPLKAFNVDIGQTFEIRYDSTRDFTDDLTIVPASDYTLDAPRGIVMLRHLMLEFPQSVKITYTGGYAASSEGDLSATIPTEIKMACLAQVMHMFGKFTAENIGKTADTTDGKALGGPYAAKMGLVPEALSLLTKYKAVGIGIY